MLWVRKLLVSLFALVTLVALVGSVVSASLNAAFSTPAKTEQWLGTSQFYEHFIANSVSQATESIGDGAGQTTTLDGNDTLVQQSVKSAFPKKLVDQSIASFLDANYAWLHGKTAIPRFTIDLSAAKTSFAEQIGQGVATHLAQIPDCTPQQLNQMQTVDLEHITCRPPGIDPSVEGLQVQQQIAGNDGFLSNPVITADTLTPQKSDAQPYYRRLSAAPKVYQWAQKVPYILAALAAVGISIIFLAAPTKRQAWRLLAKLLLTAGIVLSIGKLAFDITFNKLQDRLFTGSTAQQLQQSLTDFVQHAIDYVARIDLIGGLVYLTLAAIIIICLLLHRVLARRSRTTASVPDLENPDEQVAQPTPESAVPGKRPTALGKRGSIQ